MDRATHASVVPAVPGRHELAHWRTELRRGREQLREAFLAREGTTALLRDHARLVDRCRWREADWRVATVGVRPRSHPHCVDSCCC